MSTFVTISIGEDEFVTTEEWAKALRGMVEQAELATLEAYPEASHSIPLYLTKVGVRVIMCIKVWRSISGKNLQQSKTDIDKVRFNGERMLIGKFSYREARKITKEFEEAGSKTSLPGALFLLAKEGLDPSHWEDKG